MTSQTIVFPGDRGLLTPDYRAVTVLGLYMDTHGTWLRVEDEETHERKIVMAIRVIPLPEDSDDEPVDISDFEAEASDYRTYGGSFPRNG